MMMKSFSFLCHAECQYNSSMKKGGSNFYNLNESEKRRFDPEFMDISISEKGKMLCEQIRKVIKFEQIDIVLTSPLRRSLETADIIFQEHKQIQIIVEPLLTEHITSAADIGSRIMESQKDFQGKINFDKIRMDNQSWQLNYIIPSHKYQVIQQKNQQMNNLNKAILEVLQREGIESQEELRNRIELLKKELNELVERRKGKNIVILTHPSIIRMLSATGFFQDGQPINPVNLQYCELKPIYIILKNHNTSRNSFLCGC